MKKHIIKLLAVAVLATGVLGTTTVCKAQDKKEKTEAKEKSGSGKLPFHGKISAVDKAAKTITVGTRTFQVTASTTIIKGDDSPTTFDDAKEGEMASGSFVDNNGKLELSKLRIGAKVKDGAEGEKKKKKSE